MTSAVFTTAQTDAIEPELDCDVVVVGGGIVGATLVAALKGSGLRIIAIERQSLAQVASRQRAYALSLLSGRILSDIGVWSMLLPNIAPFRRIYLSDGDRPGGVEFGPQELNTEFLGYVAEHHVLLPALQAFIAEEDHFQWLCPARVIQVTHHQTTAQLIVDVAGEQRVVTTRLVVGADGARSHLRQQKGIKTRGWRYQQACVTFQIKHTAPCNDIAFERFWPTGPMGVLPLPGQRCQIVWTMPNQLAAQALQSLDEAAFIDQLVAHTGGHLGQIQLIGERRIFPVQLMQSQHYVQERFALVGDAAHCCHPVGGQGLNLGIRDAAALAQVLRTAQQQAQDIGSLAVLQGYEHWRKQENLVILGFTDLLTRSFSNNFGPMVTLRQLGLWGLRHIPLFKKFALELMTGLKGRAPQLAQS